MFRLRDSYSWYLLVYSKKVVILARQNIQSSKQHSIIIFSQVLIAWQTVTNGGLCSQLIVENYVYLASMIPLVHVLASQHCHSKLIKLNISIIRPVAIG